MRISIAQIRIADGAKEKNLTKIEACIEDAYGQGADILVLPELVLTGLVSQEQLKQVAESRDGESLRRIQAKLKTHPMHVLYSFPELADTGEYYITSCFLHRDGTPTAFYRKSHLFTEERDLYCLGSELYTFLLGDVKIGLLTCYDVEFPEPARSLALQSAHLIIINSANMTPYESVHRIFVQSRAMENQVFVAYCNRLGENEKYEYHGESLVVSPSGSVLMEIERDVEAVRTVQIDLEEITRAKEVFHYLGDRRRELYSF